MTKLSRFLRLVPLAFVLSAALRATEDPPVGVAVKIYARGSSVSASGTFLESSPGANDGYTSAPSGATAILGGAAGYVRVEPGKSYTVSVGGSGTNELNVVSPPGYRVLMDHLLRSRETYSGATNITFELQPLGSRHPGLAGMASSTSAAEIDWRVSLGSLRNGGSAGDLALIDTGTGVNWFNAMTPGALFYEETSDEISVYRPNNQIRQIIANQVVVDVVTTGIASFEIRCYHPSQMLGNTNPRAFSGSPYALYRIEQGATATSLKFTKEIRDTSDTNLNAAVSRREIMTLERTGTWPAFAWKRTDWTLENQTALSETVVTGGGTTANRTESIKVRTPSADPNVTNPSVLTVTRNYTVPLNNNVSTIGEVLASETVGTSTGLNATFDYYADPTKWGSLGYVKSATMPGGKWVAYDYYDSDLSTGFRGGRVKTRYEPYLNLPSAVSLTPGQGTVTSFEYVSDLFGAPVRPSLTETRINGTLVSKTTLAYDDNYTQNGLPMTQSLRLDYSDVDVTRKLQTIVRYYRDDVADAFVRGQTQSVTQPDGVKQSFAYQRGTWNVTNATFTPGPGNIGTGTASRITVVTGSNNPLAGSAVSNINSYVLDPLFVAEGKSTMDVTIRDSRALVVRTESYVRKSGDWQLVAWTNFAYDYAGRLMSRTSSNGATYTAVYSGGLKSSETDEAGVTVGFDYDAAGQVSIVTRQGSGVIGELKTKFAYDAAGRVTEERVGWTQASAEQIVSGHSFDDAGRLLTETPPGNYGVVTHSYDVANRKHTVTNAAGAQATTTNYLDGKLYSTTGNGVVPTYHKYGVETTGTVNGQQWHQVYAGLDPDLFSAPRWQKSWLDWLGRPKKNQTPGFTGQADLITENFYEDNTGHLIKTTSSGLTSATLYQYNYLGQVSRSGLDVNGNGTLDLSGNDRISETETFLEPYQNAWWSRTETRSYLKIGSGTPTLTSIARTRLTGHPINRLSETQAVDAEGNVTTQVVDVNRSLRTSTATTTRTGVANAMVETTVNGFSTGVTGFDQLATARHYDTFLRLDKVTDSRANATTSHFLSGTRMVDRVTDAAGFYSTTHYDAVGRVDYTADPKGAITRYSYNLRGQLEHQWGNGTMPVAYGYDTTYGQRTTMSTFRAGSGWSNRTGDLGNTDNPWPANPGNADTTTWTYDGPSGLLVSKKSAPTELFPNGTTVRQTYNARGQTLTRTLARDIVTTYGYDNATGELLSQTYSNEPSNAITPPVSYTYGRTGQVEAVLDGTAANGNDWRDLVYDSNKPWRLTAEVESSFYGSRTVTRMYDETGVIGRVKGFQLGATAGNNADLEQTFGFTTVGYFDTITSKRNANEASSSRTFRYAYRTDSALLAALSVDGNAFTIAREYDTQRDLIKSLDAKVGANSQTTYTYQYDAAGLRTSVVQSGAAFADYHDSNGTLRVFTYNDRGELTGDVGYLGATADSAKALPGRHYGYDYDNAGNRTWSDRTGHLNSNGQLDMADNYTTNAANQYVTRENNTLTVSGTADPGPNSDPNNPNNLNSGDGAVSVTGENIVPKRASRQGWYWSLELNLRNNYGPSRPPAATDPTHPNPWRGPLNIFAVRKGAGSGGADAYRIETRMAEIAAMLQTFDYDADGNLKTDGIVDYVYDSENRLVEMKTTTMAKAWNFPDRSIKFKYDYMGRRVQKTVADAEQVTSTNPAGIVSSRRYLYDGWNLIAEYNAPNGTSIGSLVRSYTWGLDIALSMSNAGGVGALLQIADHPTGKTYLPTYDGNGNIASLINADSGAIAAIYEYSPFGEPLRAQTIDPTIADNPFRFSTKFTDLETGLVYYGHRFYDPKNGRFINRDPIQEAGGLNLYGFCGNDGVNRWDYLGHNPSMEQILADAPSIGSESDPYWTSSVTMDDGSVYTYYFRAQCDGPGSYHWAFEDRFMESGPTKQKKTSDASPTHANDGKGIDPFSYSGLPLFPGAVVTNPDTGQKVIVVGSGGADENGQLIQYGVPLNQYLHDQAVANLAVATAAVNQSFNDLNNLSDLGTIGLEIAKGAGLALAGAAVTAVIGPVGGAILFGLATGDVVTTYSDMNNHPGNYTQGDVINFTAANTAAILTGVGIDIALSSKGGSSSGSSNSNQSSSSALAQANDTQAGFSAQDVNPTGGEMNCVNCAVAMDATLAGNPASALPGGAQPISVLGTDWVPVSGQTQVENILLKSGNGSRGIVFGSGPDVGHVWNAVNQGGKINFIDAQTGGSGNSNFQNFSDFLFLPTN